MSKRRKTLAIRLTAEIGRQSLRDYMAAAALYGIRLATLTNAVDCQIAAEAAYRMADAMLAARKKTKGAP